MEAPPLPTAPPPTLQSHADWLKTQSAGAISGRPKPALPFGGKKILPGIVEPLARATGAREFQNAVHEELVGIYRQQQDPALEDSTAQWRARGYTNPVVADYLNVLRATAQALVKNPTNKVTSADVLNAVKAVLPSENGVPEGPPNVPGKPATYQGWSALTLKNERSKLEAKLARLESLPADEQDEQALRELRARIATNARKLQELQP